MVLIGNGVAEFGVRGYVTAYDADTGKLRWRFYTAPNPTKAKDGAASRSEEHTSELQSLMRISYAVFCLTKKNMAARMQPLTTDHRQTTYQLYKPPQTIGASMISHKKTTSHSKN